MYSYAEPSIALSIRSSCGASKSSRCFPYCRCDGCRRQNLRLIIDCSTNESASDEEGVDAGFLELRRHDLGLLNGDQSVLVAMDDKDRGIVQAEKGAANDSRLERT